MALSNTEWYLTKPRNSGIEGVVGPVSNSHIQAVQGPRFVERTFEDSAIPILVLREDTLDAPDRDDEEIMLSCWPFCRLGCA
jgi:hypothetical protein